MAYVRKASASQLNMLHACPMQWYQNYIAQDKQPTTTAMLKGTLLHSVSETFYQLDIRNAGVHKDDYETKFKAHAWKVFDEQLEIPRKYFSKTLPSIKEDLQNLHPDPLNYAMEIGDCKMMVIEMLNTFLRDFKVKLQKYKNIQRSWYICKPKYTEYELSNEFAIGFIDEVLEIDGKIVIVDLKTSNSYRALFSESHYRQLKFYTYLFYLQTGKLAEYGVIKFIRTGFECCYPMGQDVISEMEREMDWYKKVTASTDINSYKCAVDYTFCTCNAATNVKNRGKGWCYWAPKCNKILNCENESI